MTTELTVLVLAALLQVVQMLIPGYYMTRTAEGRAWNQTPRDVERKPGIQEGRASRAFLNMDQNLLLFAIAVVVIAVTGGGSWWTGLLAWAWLLLRAVYVPAYVLGWVPWRSAIWAASGLCLLLLLLAALF